MEETISQEFKPTITPRRGRRPKVDSGAAGQATAKHKGVDSNAFLLEEIRRLNDRIEQMVARAATAGEVARDQWVNDPTVPEGLQQGGFHDVSNPPQGVTAQRVLLADDPKTSVSPRLMQQMGIDPNVEEPVWRLRDNWQNQNFNDVEEFLDHNKDGRVCVDGSGQKHYRGDLVLCARPKKYGSELVNSRLNQRAKEDYEIYPNREKQPTESEMIEMREANREALRKLLEGSPTKGKSLAEAGRIYTKEQTTAIRDRYLYQGREPATPSKSAMENIVDRAVEESKAAARGRGKMVTV